MKDIVPLHSLCLSTCEVHLCALSSDPNTKLIKLLADTKLYFLKEPDEAKLMKSVENSWPLSRFDSSFFLSDGGKDYKKPLMTLTELTEGRTRSHSRFFEYFLYGAYIICIRFMDKYFHLYKKQILQKDVLEFYLEWT